MTFRFDFKVMHQITGWVDLAWWNSINITALKPKNENSQFLDSKTNGENPIELRCIVLEKAAWNPVCRISDFTARVYIIGSWNPILQVWFALSRWKWLKGVTTLLKVWLPSTNPKKINVREVQANISQGFAIIVILLYIVIYSYIVVWGWHTL